MNKIYQENKKTIWVIAGISAAAALAVAIYGIVNKKKKASHSTLLHNDGELTKQEKAKLISSIKVEYDGSYLTVRTITQITEAVVRLAIPEFTRLTKQDRAERRKNRENLDKYIQLWDRYTQSLEEIVEKNQKEVLRALKINDLLFESSNSHYLSENNQELFLMHATLPQRLKTGLKPTKKLSLPEFREIIRSQIAATNQEAVNIARISSKTRNPEEAAPILGNRVNDFIFYKYTVEEEDVFAALQLYVDDPDVQQLFRELQAANMRLLPMPEGLF